MREGRIPKDILHGELAEGKPPTGRPQLRLKDICKRDLKSMNINTNAWETLAKDRSAWMEAVKDGLDTFEERPTSNTEEKRRRRKKKQQEGHKDSAFYSSAPLWKGLSFKNWPFQPQQKMLPVRNSIV